MTDFSIEALAARAMAFRKQNPHVSATDGEVMICLALIGKKSRQQPVSKSEPPEWLKNLLLAPHTYVSARDLLQRAGKPSESQIAMRQVKAWLLQLGYRAAKLDGRSVYVKPLL